MKLGYARVSTTAQELYLQTDALNAAGCSKIFTDIASGSKAQRPGLDQVLSHLREGDVLVVWRLDRLGRSLKHLIQSIEELNSKGIGFHSLTENLDTLTPGGKLLFHIFGAIAEFERALLRERVHAGLEAMRSRGVKGGRRISIPQSKIEAVDKAREREPHRSMSEICEEYGVAITTYYRRTKVSLKKPVAYAKYNEISKNETI